MKPTPTINIVSGRGNVDNHSVSDRIPVAAITGAKIGDTQFRIVKTLTERFNEAYDEEAKREDEEFLRSTKAYYRRRYSNED